MALGDLNLSGNISCTNLDVSGVATFASSGQTTARSSLTQDDYAVEHIDDGALRVWDAYQTLIATAGSDDLGITAGAFATGCAYITGGDMKALGATTRRLRFRKTLGPEYVDGQSLRIILSAGMLTTVADTTCTVDLECYLEAGDTLKSGSDLVTTGAQSMNSLTFATLNFELSSAALVRGNKLDFRLSITCTDAATATAVTPAIAALSLAKDIKG